MLEEINIKNFVLIDSVSLEFSRGLNILTGETGAGKSILIGALTFLLGGKTGVEQIRTGSPDASVSGTIVVPQNSTLAKSWLQEHDIELEDDRLLLRRVIKNTGRNSCWIGDTPVSRNELEEFTSFLFDIHGQHEHQALLKAPLHRRYLDSYAEINPQVSEFTKLYTLLAEKRATLKELQLSDKDRQEKKELLQFAIEEINEAKLIPDEENSLEQEETRLSQFEKIYSSIEQFQQMWDSGEETLLSVLKKSKHLIENSAQLDSVLQPVAERLNNAYYEIEDLQQVVRQYGESLTFDPERLEEIQQRLVLISKLKKKYANMSDPSINSVLKYRDDAEKQLEALSSTAENYDSLSGQITSLEKEILSKGTILHEKRVASSKPLETGIMNILKTLGMKDAIFSVQIRKRPVTESSQVCGPYGFDDIEFMISSNSGEPLRPLAKIASGGEISRVMLAIKTVLANADEADTLVFDEIDSGIGGEVALEVGAHLKKLGSVKQILCITHLASIAVRADNHIKIQKQNIDGRTITSAATISKENRATEIARMLSGDVSGEASILHAKEMLQKYGGN